MAALSASMVALFEASMLLVRIMLSRKIKAQQLPEVE
jgi:Sec-independent protein secretion pathway component TatC